MEQVIHQQWSYCPRCGKALASTGFTADSSAGTEAWRFCPVCGMDLGNTAPPPAPAVLPPPAPAPRLALPQERCRTYMRIARYTLLGMAIVSWLQALLLLLITWLARMNDTFAADLGTTTKAPLLMVGAFTIAAVGGMFLILFFWARSNIFAASLSGLIVCITLVMITLAATHFSLNTIQTVGVLYGAPIALLGLGVKHGLEYRSRQSAADGTSR